MPDPSDSLKTISTEQKPANSEQALQPSPETLGIWAQCVQIIRKLMRKETQRESLERLVRSEKNDAAALSTDERALIGNVLKFRDRRAEDVMLPRADIVGISADSTLGEAAQAFVESGFSRMPVYENTLDEVKGFIHVKDLTHGLTSEDKTWTVDKACREILVVAPSMYISDLLVAMRTAKRHLAIVIDEYGGVDGLITIEDLMEEIVGDIEDEHDVSEGVDVIARPSGDYIVRARTRLEVLQNHIGSFLTEEEAEEVDTVGGLVSHMAGKLPLRGEALEHSSGLQFEVLETTPRKVVSVRIWPVTGQSAHINS